MEMVMVMGMVGLPIVAFAFFVLYKIRQQERREKESDLKAQNT